MCVFAINISESIGLFYKFFSLKPSIMCTMKQRGLNISALKHVNLPKCATKFMASPEQNILRTLQMHLIPSLYFHLASLCMCKYLCIRQCRNYYQFRNPLLENLAKLSVVVHYKEGGKCCIKKAKMLDHKHTVKAESISGDL